MTCEPAEILRRVLAGEISVGKAGELFGWTRLQAEEFFFEIHEMQERLGRKDHVADAIAFGKGLGS